MIKDDCTNYVLTVEEPAGCMIICQEYEDRGHAMKAYEMVMAGKVTLYKQECKTTVLARSVKHVLKRGRAFARHSS